MLTSDRVESSGSVAGSAGFSENSSTSESSPTRMTPNEEASDTGTSMHATETSASLSTSSASIAP